MKTLNVAAAAAILALGACFSDRAIAEETLSLVNSSVAVANTRAAPETPAFADWCVASGAPFCVPTTQLPVYDSTTGRPMGMAYVWGAFPFNAGTGAFAGSICFSEFIVIALAGGELHLKTGPNGTCGAFIDPALMPPKYPELGATSVVAGGGDGVIVGGTGKYKNSTGSFSDRVFVGFGAPSSGVGGIVYYDHLLFRISVK